MVHRKNRQGPSDFLGFESERRTFERRGRDRRKDERRRGERRKSDRRRSERRSRGVAKARRGMSRLLTPEEKESVSRLYKMLFGSEDDPD